MKISHAVEINREPGINIFCRYKAGAGLLPVSRRELADFLMKMVMAERILLPVSAIELNLVDDAEIAKVNLSNLGIQGPTNIISFPGSGILVLSLDTFHRECLLYGQTPLLYLIHLLAHGLGHLAGFEHSAEMDAFCNKCETAAFTAAGGNPIDL